MGVATVYADAHISGSFASPDNVIGNTPTTWAGVLNTNSNYSSRWSLSNLASALTPGATQTIRVLAKKGTNSGSPTISINLYENGSLVANILATTTVTSTTGEVLTATFNTSVITVPNNVEIDVVETGAGGSGSARNSAQISYIAWDADVDTDPKHVNGGSGGSLDISGAGAGTAAAFYAASGSSGGQITISGVGSGAGSGGEFRILSGSSGGSVSITGSGSGTKSMSGESSGSINIQGAGNGVGKSPMVFLTKQVKRGGSLTPAAVYKKNNGILVQTGGHTR